MIKVGKNCTTAVLLLGAFYILEHKTRWLLLKTTADNTFPLRSPMAVQSRVTRGTRIFPPDIQQAPKTNMKETYLVYDDPGSNGEDSPIPKLI